MSSRAAPLQLRRIELSALPEVATGVDLLVCQTPQWLEFLRVSQGAEPLVAEVLRDGARVGVFTGALVRKAGLRILGSPLRGWTTSYMGCALSMEVPTDVLGAALRQFAFRTLGCAHVEVLDRQWDAAALARPWMSQPLHGFEIDLSRSEDELFAAMSPACRRCLRKADKSGLTVEEVTNPDGFAAEFYSQLREVFAKDGLAPSYPERRVAQLIDVLQPAGLLLLLRARDAGGRCIATALFPGHGRLMYFWGGASRRDALLNRPNEALLWHALRCWKARGVQRFDMGGAGDYKAKYGGVPIAVPWARCSRSPAVAALRWGAEAALRARQRIAGRRRHRRLRR